jgi:uncharacterized RDD family membrane protein YckC
LVGAFHHALETKLIPSTAPPALWTRRILAAAADFAGIAAVLIGLYGLLAPDVREAAMFPALFAGPFVWFVGFESLFRGQTPGKMLVRIRVTDRLGYDPSPAQALLRNLGKVMFLPLNVLAVMVWIFLKRPYYDVLPKTAVVTVPPRLPVAATVAGFTTKS